MTRTATDWDDTAGLLGMWNEGEMNMDEEQRTLDTYISFGVQILGDTQCCKALCPLFCLSHFSLLFTAILCLLSPCSRSIAIAGNRTPCPAREALCLRDTCVSSLNRCVILVEHSRKGCYQ